jgi:hypothetical protein
MKREKLLNIVKQVFIGWLEVDEKFEVAEEQIVALIKKPEVTEEWIEEKAIRLFRMAMKWFSDEKITSQQKVEIGQGFIRTLMEDVSITVDPHGKSGKE